MTILIICIIIFGVIISALLLLKQSATKFHLTEEQKEKIKAREIELTREEAQDD
jgi:uncharacterized protein YpmB